MQRGGYQRTATLSYVSACLRIKAALVRATVTASIRIITLIKAT